MGEPKLPVQMLYHNPGDFGAFKTRISTKKKIMEALKDKDVSIIGICGMPGVGKTTMANELADEVEVDKLFDEVAIASVSQDPDVTKIQDQLADMLGQGRDFNDATDIIKGTAEKVTRECGGLPLALVTVGKALRKRGEHSWKNALEELRNSRVTNIKGVHKLVYLRIEFSYNYLESDKAKSLLL
ncbi:disease resistance At4g27190-like [Olea europaea subsp. europaea]|uniref:Disease resistance At4g27190-like n=1 Tax=Olea europaea subsp. europaea TaxID=158383 RepID=A0A8S0TD59_OLEEU|nr:disease resistance At4g27190-like [Olea europaea subsp. europaea]